METKTSHVFGRRKRGTQERFHREYLRVKEQIVVPAWAEDAERQAEAFSLTFKSNQALAKAKSARAAEMAAQTAREILGTVFQQFHQEIHRIVSDLGGYPQEDGMVLFPDGSTAKLPKGLYVEPENLMRFE